MSGTDELCLEHKSELAPSVCTSASLPHTRGRRSFGEGSESQQVTEQAVALSFTRAGFGTYNLCPVKRDLEDVTRIGAEVVGRGGHRPIVSCV